MIDINDYNRRDIMVSCLLEAVDILEEGAVKTAKKNKLDNYLKRYNYKGDKKSGIIEVDGKKYKIDRDINNKLMYHTNSDIPVQRQTSADLVSDGSYPVIHIDKIFTDLKNNKRRDAVLNHEIGHAKLHQTNNPNNINTIRKYYGERLSDEDLDYDIKKEVMKSVYGKNKTHKPRTLDEQRRVQNIHHLNKYEKEDNPHAKIVEYEADAYARTHKNGDQLKRAIREMAKNGKKNSKKILNSYGDLDNNTKKVIISNYNKITQEDMNMRTKASKDKRINTDVYRNI